MPTRIRTARGAPRDGALVERSEEVSWIEATLDGAQSGEGASILIEAAPGIGKSRLVEHACDLARAAGVRILRARGSELESSFAFGIVRQLLERPLDALDVADRDGILSGAAGSAAPLVAERRRRPRPGSERPEASGLHGLYWLTANLTKECPLLLCVDDAHWADEPSLRWLSYLAHRLADLPVCMIVASRRVRGGPTRELLRALERASATSVIALNALSLEGTHEVIADLLRLTPDNAFVTACHTATAGSPLLLVELVRSLESAALEPNAGNVQRLFSSGPASLTRAALARLRGLPEGAVELTRAVAILERSSVRNAATLADVEHEDAERAAQSLVDVGVLADGLPLEFVHPVIRSCVYADISVPARASAHLRAAQLLAADGADDERVASHLLHAEPSGATWVLDTLRHASATVWARGASDIAVRYLRRALAEFPLGERPASVLFELGRAEVRAGDVDAAIEHFGGAVTLAENPVARARASLDFGAALIMAAKPVQAAERLRDALGALGPEDREWGLRLQAQLDVAAWTSAAARDIAAAARPARFKPALEAPTGAADRTATAVAAVSAALDTHGLHRAAELARVAHGDGLLLEELNADDPVLALPAVALLYAERLAWAGEVLSQLLATVSRHGSRRGAAMGSAWRGMASLRAGRPGDAEIDSREVLESEVPAGLGTGHCTMVALAVLIEALVDLGRVTEAEELASRFEIAGGRPQGLFGAHLAFALGRLREAQTRWPEAEARLRECAALHGAWGVSAPAALPWRGRLAMIVAAAGRESEARGLASSALAHARDGDSLLDLGVALRAAGSLAESPDHRIALLREAVSTLRETEARLEIAHALADLGSALRRAGLRREARPELSLAHEQARTLGAIPLADRVRSELVVLGAKPRRGPKADRDELTAAEIRVAQLTAEGATNRRVADELFITAKTVEYHLTSVYRKLNISSRHELAAAVDRRLVPPPNAS